MVEASRTPTKAELLDALRSSGKKAVEKLRALPPERFEEGRYESGWNGREILAHFASIEWTYPRLLDVAKQAQASPPPPSDRLQPPRTTAEGEAGSPPARSAQGGIDSYNERQVAKRAQASIAELLEEFQKNRAATIAAVEGADASLLATPIRSAGGVTGALSGVIFAVAVLHVLGHAGDIVGEQLTL